MIFKTDIYMFSSIQYSSTHGYKSAAAFNGLCCCFTGRLSNHVRNMGINELACSTTEDLQDDCKDEKKRTQQKSFGYSAFLEFM